MAIKEQDQDKDKRKRHIVNDLDLRSKEGIALIASSIKSISDGFESLLAEGLTEEAIAVLIARKIPVGIPDIKRVLDALPRLKGWYLK